MKTYDAVVAQRLKPILEAHDWARLIRVLEGFSNSQFRTASTMLGDKLTATLDDEAFWQLFQTLVTHDAKAYLGTMLKPVVQRMQSSATLLQETSAQAALMSLQGRSVDVQKTLAALLPLLQQPEDVEQLFRLLDVADGEPRITALLRITTPVACYMLVQALRYVDHDRSLLIRTTHFLMKRGDSMSFNVASLLRSYFGLDEVKGTFSLQLAPYELARIIDSYQTFTNTISR